MGSARQRRPRPARVKEAIVNQRTRFVTAVANRLHRHLLWFLLGAYAAAALWPAPGVRLQEVTLGQAALFGETTRVTLPMMMLALLLLNAGLGVQISRPRELLRTSPLLAAGLAANLLIPLAFLFVAAQALRPWHEPDEAQYILVGLALVAAMPVAASSTAWSQNNNGDLSVSLGLVVLSTLLSPLTTPLSLQAAGQMAGEGSADELQRLASVGTGSFLILFVALPSALGIVGRRVVGGPGVDRIRPHLKLVNCLILLALNYTNGAVSLPEVVAYPDWDFLALTLGVAALLCVAAFASGWWLGKLLRADRAGRTALMFGLGMSNNGSGLVLAAVALAGRPRVMLPIIFYNLVQHLVAGAAAYLLNGGRGTRSGVTDTERQGDKEAATPLPSGCPRHEEVAGPSVSVTP
jgi:BASS family bile acid:Na+ symporter